MDKEEYLKKARASYSENDNGILEIDDGIYKNDFSHNPLDNPTPTEREIIKKQEEIAYLISQNHENKYNSKKIEDLRKEIEELIKKATKAEEKSHEILLSEEEKKYGKEWLKYLNKNRYIDLNSFIDLKKYQTRKKELENKKSLSENEEEELAQLTIKIKLITRTTQNSSFIDKSLNYLKKYWEDKGMSPLAFWEKIKNNAPYFNNTKN